MTTKGSRKGQGGREAETRLTPTRPVRGTANKEKDSSEARTQGNASLTNFSLARNETNRQRVRKGEFGVNFDSQVRRGENSG